MSQYFESGGEVLWNPATRVAGLFMDMAAAHARLLGIPSGLGPMESDECQVDVPALAAFTDALLRYCARSNHVVMMSLMEGFAATALAVVEIGGGTVPAAVEFAGDPGVARIVETARRNASAMPR